MQIRTFRNSLINRKQWTTCPVYNMFIKFSLGKIILSVFCDLNWEWSFKFAFKNFFQKLSLLRPFLMHLYNQNNSP